MDPIEPLRRSTLELLHAHTGVNVTELFRLAHAQREHLPQSAVGPYMSKVPTALSPAQLHERLGGLSDVKTQWYSRADLGDVSPVPPVPSVVRTDEEREILPETADYVAQLQAGTNVFVNFVNLDPLADAGLGDIDAEHPARVVGIDADPVHVAAARVGWRLATRARSVYGDQFELLQALYSTTWSLRTLAAFAAAADDELSVNVDPEWPSEAEAAVRRVLRDWVAISRDRGAQLTIADARRICARRVASAPQGTAAASCWALALEEDRLEVAAYELTGEVPLAPPSEGLEARLRPMVASLLFFYGIQPDSFDDPRASPPPNVLFGLRLDQMHPPVENIDEFDVEGDGLGDPLMTRVRAALLVRCDALHRLSCGAVSCEFHCASACNVAHLLSAQSPVQVVWRHALDNMSFEAFHALARAVGAPSGSTLHYASAARWTERVMGASLVDIFKLEHSTQHVGTVLQMGLDVMQLQARLSGMGRRIMHPLPESPISLASTPLAMRFGDSFAKAFADNARADGSHCVARLLAVLPVLPMNVRGRNVLHVVFSYDRSVQLAISTSSKVV
jgi:hypothetical protein